MNIINRFRPAKQFRYLPLVGKDAPFGYVERLTTQAEENNYQASGPMVPAATDVVPAVQVPRLSQISELMGQGKSSG